MTKLNVQQYNAIPKLLTRNEGLSKREFAMTVMYRINQSVTTRVAHCLTDKNSVSSYTTDVLYVAKQRYRKPDSFTMFA
jgi:hypothetical protein